MPSTWAWPPASSPGRTALNDAGGALRAAWNLLPAQRGLDARGILEAAAAGRIDCLVLLGADPLADFPDRDLAARAVAAVERVIALDAFLTASSEQADIVLPAAAFAEKSGTTTNLEGRVSPLSQKVTPPGTSYEDWMVAAELADRLGADLGVTSVEDIWGEIATVSPIHETLGTAPPDGMLFPGTGSTFAVTDSELAPPSPSSYDFRLVVDRDLYDAGTFTAHSPSLAGLARGAVVLLNPADVDRRGIGPGSRIQVVTPRTTVVMAAAPDERIPRGVARLAFNQPDSPSRALIDVTADVTDVRLEPA